MMCHDIDKVILNLELHREYHLKKVQEAETAIKVMREMFNRPAGTVMPACEESILAKAPSREVKKSVSSIEPVSKKEKSKYKGVSKTSHGDKWRAQFYIPGKGIIAVKDKDGKGSFDTEEQAHRVYVDFKEQYENNPDKPNEKRKYSKEKSIVNIQEDKIKIERWECMKCKRIYITSQMPVRCVPECGSISFNMIS